MIPAGKVFVMIPIMDKFDVYEVFDDRDMQEPNSMVATVRGHRLAHDGPIRFGGVLRKIKFKDQTKKAHKFYLETLFYTNSSPVSANFPSTSIPAPADSKSVAMQVETSACDGRHRLAPFTQ